MKVKIGENAFDLIKREVRDNGGQIVEIQLCFQCFIILLSKRDHMLTNSSRHALIGRKYFGVNDL